MLSTSTSTDDIIAHEANHAPGSWPIYIDECFGWLHMPVGTRGASTAVLLCAGFKEDKVSGHRSLRLLADALATAGYPTLRFDYAGAGDSRDIGTTEPWATWQQNTHVAADWLRQRSGASRIILCGLRLGATLAALAAEARDDVAGLVLFAPVLRGRTYLRQIAVEARTGQTRAADDGLTLDDVCLSSETVDAIKAVDLRKVAVPSGCKVLIHAQETSPILSECIAAWVARGVDVELKDFTKFEAMLRPYFMSHEADAEVSSVSDWLRPRFPPGPGISPLPGLPHSESLRVDGYVETPLRFGSNEHLFAVLCRPFGRPEASVAVVIPNSSGAPHYGNARAGVDLARRLAASGIASLRIDFDGLGDSGAPDGLPTHVFETDRKSDVAAAVDVLEQLGFRRCVMLGLCSGAYHALQATLADTRINLQVLVNLPLFQWRSGDPIELMGWANESRTELLRKFFRRVLLGLLGRELPGNQGESVTQREWFVRRMKAAGSRLVGLSVPRTRYARQCMTRLAPRARTLFLFSAGDDGLKMLEHVFGANREPPSATIRIMPEIDHGLSTGAMRRVVAEQVITFLNTN